MALKAKINSQKLDVASLQGVDKINAEMVKAFISSTELWLNWFSFVSQKLKAE